MRARAFTLIETVIWIGLFTAAMAALTSSALSFYRVNRYTLAQASAIASAQHAIDQAVRTMREAAYASDGAYPVISMASNQFSFYADIDDDPFVEKVRYFIDGTELKRGVVDPSGDPAVYTGPEVVSVVSEDVRNAAESTPAFTYSDGAGAEITDLSRISDLRFVTLRLVVDVDEHAAPEAITLFSSAALRNIR